MMWEYIHIAGAIGSGNGRYHKLIETRKILVPEKDIDKRSNNSFMDRFIGSIPNFV